MYGRGAMYDVGMATGGTAGTGGVLLDSVQKSARAAAPAAAAPGFSGTNNQEQGVDEPDLVKTNGTLMLVLRQRTSTLEAIDVNGAPKLLSHLKVELPQIASLLLSGDTAVVLGQRFEGRNSVTTAEVYDVRDGSAMTHLRTFRVDGNLLDARFVHGRILLVTQSSPTLAWSYPGGPLSATDALLVIPTLPLLVGVLLAAGTLEARPGCHSM